VNAAEETRHSQLRRAAEVLCWLTGVALTVWYALMRVDATVSGQLGLEDFAGRAPAPDQSFWSASRVRAYTAVLGVQMQPPVAVLNIPSISLQVAVFADSSELSLNRGAGLIPGMGLPDRGGNVGISGHRDGFFRALRNVHQGDLIELRTHRTLYRYRINGVEIVDATDTRPLADTDSPTITLVTCYPFYFVGSAPQRFIVRGEFQWPSASAPRTPFE
jgi:sortase A